MQDRIEAFHERNALVVKLAEHRRRIKILSAALDTEPTETYVGLWFEGEHNTSSETLIGDDVCFFDVSTHTLNAMLIASLRYIEAQLDDLLGDPMDGRHEDRKEDDDDDTDDAEA